MKKKIGVLAVQGAFAEHIDMLHTLGADGIEIRQKSDLRDDLEGIILPGGESTVIGKLLKELNMLYPLKGMILEGIPVFGTCAGMILLAGQIVNDPHIYLGTMDISVKRNAYGRQLGSFQTMEPMANVGDIPMVFIRAPYIEHIGKEAEILATYDGHIVAARQKHMLVTSFHPELTKDTGVHQYFIEQL